MFFYPIIFTRTALRDLQKNREGFDFYMRARPSQLPDEIRELIDQITNEDHFPRMTAPRRIFYRTDRFIFWGLALHNEWFLPSETMQSLDMSEAERKFRGFWGGWVDISQNKDAELLPSILASLMECPTNCCLDESLSNLSKTQTRIEASAEDTAFPSMEFVGRSNFCFPARLFQHFIQKDWFENQCPVQKENLKRPNQPLISDIPYALELFVPETPVSWEIHEFPNKIHPKSGNIQLLAPMDSQDEKRFWADLILSEQNVCIVSALSELAHVVRFTSLQVALMQDIPERDYISFPAKPSRTEMSQRPKTRPSGVEEFSFSPPSFFQDDPEPCQKPKKRAEPEDVSSSDECSRCLYKAFVETFQSIWKLFEEFCSTYSAIPGTSSRKGKKKSNENSAKSPDYLKNFDPFEGRKNLDSGNVTKDSRPKNRMMDDLED